MDVKPAYFRVLIKISGEALAGGKGRGLDFDFIEKVCLAVKKCTVMGVQTAIVVGGGNIFRGMKGADKGFSRVKGDSMGMLATTINALALQCGFENNNQKARVLTSTLMEPYAERYSQNRAVEALENSEIVIFSGGTGNPFFTTDSAAALRGVEIGADILIKGTRVDGIYSADPEKDPSAVKYDTLTFAQTIERNLKVMDLTAFALCSENNLPILVFDMNVKNGLKSVVLGEKIGTLVK